MTLLGAYSESKKTKQESGNNYRDHAIFRKATGLVVEFKSANSPRTNSAYPFPTRTWKRMTGFRLSLGRYKIPP